MDPKPTPSDPRTSAQPLASHEEPGVSHGERGEPSGETREREAARRRGRERRARGAGGHEPEVGRADPELAHRAFSALAENVRDYAIFLMDPDGVIRFWGEGAHLLKRWLKEEAEGAHLRLLYPEGGAEDGTAEEHLREAAAQGEYVGEGHRVRSDGTTFWARVTLTALKDEQHALMGFSKVTIDLTTQRAADGARALGRRDAQAAAGRVERADLTAEIEVLKEEVAVLRKELARRDP